MTAGTDDVVFLQCGNPELSRNEIENLCAKAARGAGLSWGHADDAGFAAGWLHAHGIDGVGLLASHLAQIDEVDWSVLSPVVSAGDWSAAAEAPLCPIAVGTTLSDFCDLPEGRLDQGLRIGPIRQPLLVIPFLSRISSHLGCGITVDIDARRIYVAADGLTGDMSFIGASSACYLTLGHAETPAPAAQPNYHCDPGAIAALGSFALCTTVPPSENSRADAGTDQSDTD